MTQVIAKVNPKHLILVHGSLDACMSWRTSDLKNKHYVHIPQVGEKMGMAWFPKICLKSTSAN